MVTGKIAGKYPISWIKVSIVVAAVLLLIFIYLVLHNGGHTSMNFRFHH